MSNRKFLLLSVVSFALVGFCVFSATNRSFELKNVSAEDCKHDVIEHYDATNTTIEHWACCECHNAWADAAKEIVVRDGSMDKTRSATYYEAHSYKGDTPLYWGTRFTASYDSLYGFSYTHEIGHAETKMLYVEVFEFDFDFEANPIYEVELTNNTTGFLHVNVLHSNWADYPDLDDMNINVGETKKIRIDAKIKESGSGKFVLRLNDNFGNDFTGSLTISKPSAPVDSKYTSFEVTQYGNGANKVAYHKEETKFGRAVVFTANHNTEIYFRGTTSYDASIYDSIQLHIYSTSTTTLHPCIQDGSWGGSQYEPFIRTGWNTVSVELSKWNTGSIIIFNLYLADTDVTFKLVVGEPTGPGSYAAKLNAFELPQTANVTTYLSYLLDTVNPVLDEIDAAGLSENPLIAEKYNYFRSINVISSGFKSFGYGTHDTETVVVDGITCTKLTNIVTGDNPEFSTSVTPVTHSAHGFYLFKIYNPCAFTLNLTIYDSYNWDPTKDQLFQLAPQAWTTVFLNKAGYTANEIGFIFRGGELVPSTALGGDVIISPLVDYVHPLSYGMTSSQYLEARKTWSPLSKDLGGEHGVTHTFAECNSEVEDAEWKVTSIYVRGREAIDEEKYSGIKIWIKNNTTQPLWLNCNITGNQKGLGGIPNDGSWVELTIDLDHWNASGHLWLNFNATDGVSHHTGSLSIAGFTPIAK
jgi:hypothetical protein